MVTIMKFWTINTKLSYHTTSTTILLTTALLLSSIYSVQSISCGDKLCLGGVCDQLLNCTCSAQYPDCRKETNATCADVTGYCLNSSNCTAIQNDEVECQCADGFAGPQCELTICDATAFCSGQGNCTLDNTNTRNCQCDPCYNGATCSELVDMSSIPVEHACSNTSSSRVRCEDGNPKQYCHCFPGYTGEKCTVELNECESNPCINGNCNDLANKYKCDCADGWKGTNCDLDIDECAADYCHIGNTESCNNTAGTYQCECAQGYTGVNCTAPTCTQELCNYNGTCTTNSTHWSCDCGPFYEGVQCEIKGPCLDNPCKNGNCTQSEVNGTLEHLCTCNPGWQNNKTCNVNIDECDDSDICKNGGNCTDTEGSFTCQCTEYWTGELCAADVKECEQADWCENSGICTELQGNYSCDCTGTGYIGTNCEIRDYCSEFCSIDNRLSCKNLPDRADCKCAENYLGSDCNTMDPCASNPCNEGVCSNNDLATGFVCQCEPKYTGTTCNSSLEVQSTPDPNLPIYIAVPLVVAITLAFVIGLVICFIMAKKKRATRGRYSPSRHEILGPNLQMSGVLKPPPEERLI